MDSFEINKIVAAILMVALLIIGIAKVSNIIFHVEKPKNPGYSVEVEQEANNSATAKIAEEKEIDISALLALGDVASGGGTSDQAQSVACIFSMTSGSTMRIFVYHNAGSSKSVAGVSNVNNTKTTFGGFQIG